MNEEIYAYQQYLLNFRIVKKPSMPKFNVSAYTDNEYKSLIFSLSNFEKLDEEYLTIQYLKG